MIATSAMSANEKAARKELILALVTPARNEAALIERTILSVVAQTMRPVRWVIVSDGSTDGTDEIIKSYAEKHDWIEYLRMPPREKRHFGGKAIAFGAAYERLRDISFDVIGNLDADITLAADHFEYFVNKFQENAKLGVAGAPFRDGTQQYDYRFTSIEHVSGACQLFRRECFEEVGGYKPLEIGGVDLVAVTTARMKGWETRSYPERTCFHHRTVGSAQRGPLEIAFRGGVGDYRLGMHPLWETVRTPYQMTKKPFFVAGALRWLGFFWALTSRQKKVISSELENFRQREQMARLKQSIGGILGHGEAR